MPALVATRLDLRGALSAAGSHGVFGARGRLTKYAVVVTEVALGVVLLVGAGLLIRTLLELQHLEPGFDPRPVIAARISLDDERYADSVSVERLFRRGIERLLELPEVEAAGVGLTLPYERALNLGFVHVSGGVPEEQGHPTDVVYVTPGYLETLRVPLIRGRLIDSRDRDGARNAIVVNRAFVRHYLADREVQLGARIALSGTEREIVGVVGDVQQLPTWSGSDPLGAVPTVYLPVAQVPDGLFRLVHTWFSPSWVARLRPGADAAVGGRAAAALEEALAGLDPQLPVASVRSMAEVQSAAWSRQRVQATLLGSLAALGLLLAAIGLYSLVAGAVVEREREVGLRMVMGASAAKVVRVVATPGVVLALLGLGLGLALALGGGGLMRHLLWGVSAHDPWTFTVAALVLLGTAITASVLPTLRLLRTDPARALREE